MRNASLMAALVLILTACASTGGTRSGGTPDVITSEELRATEGVENAYQALQRLRPRFLSGRTGSRGTRRAVEPLARTSDAGEASGVVVYFDGVRLGGVGELRGIGIERVGEIRFVNGRDATTKYGTNHGAGVIEVTSTR